LADGWAVELADATAASLDIPMVVKKETKKVGSKAYVLVASKATTMAEWMDHWTVVSMVVSKAVPWVHLLVDPWVEMTAVQTDPCWVEMKAALKVVERAEYLAEWMVDQ